MRLGAAKARSSSAWVCGSLRIHLDHCGILVAEQELDQPVLARLENRMSAPSALRNAE